jgi:chemotaxis protein MotB
MRRKQGHHGGSWKVAYADFVTAMMALFLTLWLTAQDERIKEAVERAFRHPFSSLNDSSGIIPSSKEIRSAKQERAGSFNNPAVIDLQSMLVQLQQVLQQSDVEGGRSVQLEMLPDGIKISVFDRARQPIFEPQSSELTRYGDLVLSTLAWPVSHYTNFNVEIEGHTETGRPPIREGYGNWELSTDRANTARRRLLVNGVQPEQVRKVAGYADTVPLPHHAPEDETNRRVTILLKVRSVIEGRPTAGISG